MYRIWALEEFTTTYAAMLAKRLRPGDILRHREMSELPDSFTVEGLQNGRWTFTSPHFRHIFATVFVLKTFLGGDF
ncbi:MAG TPA: hypothetical protein DD465_04845 [Thalassospira sp.]|jgi:hypothetical protein|nr:hypothetical protein [Thalassospira sp.]|tara:strand:+ start:1022 stop:1249 length:228 start_codon:yes stop_codon:yes gene_type:complete